MSLTLSSFCTETEGLMDYTEQVSVNKISTFIKLYAVHVEMNHIRKRKALDIGM